MPADRVTKDRGPKHVPDLGDPDRKRVLNVLAQRRYRQRRREKIAVLEAQAKSIQDLVGQHSTTSDESSPQASSTSVINRCPNAVHELPVVQDDVEELINMPCEDGLLGFTAHEDPFDMALIHGFSDLTNLPTPLPSTPDSTDFQQTSTSPTLGFPMTADSGILTIPVMSMVKTLMSIATALNVLDHLWDPSYMHVISPSLSLDPSLPANLRPVPAQMAIPHHPALDLLPWPTVREKLICMLAMPSKLRPPVAREEDDDEGWPGLNGSGPSSSMGQSRAITQLVQDLDDFQDGGGLIMHGNSVAWGEGNEFVEEAWEVGELFYRKWWFCLDERIVAQSNTRRRERGLGKLRLAP